MEKIIYLSSDDKTDATQSNSDFTVSLKERYNTQNITRVLVKDISVPNVFYNIRSSNGAINNFFIMEVQGGPSGGLPITIPEGQYTIDQLLPVLKAEIEAVYAGIAPVTVQQDDITQLLTISWAGPSGGKIYDNKSGTSPMADVLGYTTTTPVFSTTLTSNYSPDLSGINMVYVHSKEIAEAHGIDGDFGLISVVENVSFSNVPYGAYAYRQNSDNELALIDYDQVRNLNYISIILRDNKGNKLDIGNKKMTVIIKVFYAV